MFHKQKDKDDEAGSGNEKDKISDLTKERAHLHTRYHHLHVSNWPLECLSCWGPHSHTSTRETALNRIAEVNLDQWANSHYIGQVLQATAWVFKQASTHKTHVEHTQLVSIECSLPAVITPLLLWMWVCYIRENEPLQCISCVTQQHYVSVHTIFMSLLVASCYLWWHHVISGSIWT